MLEQVLKFYNLEGQNKWLNLLYETCFLLLFLILAWCESADACIMASWRLPQLLQFWRLRLKMATNAGGPWHTSGTSSGERMRRPLRRACAGGWDDEAALLSAMYGL